MIGRPWTTKGSVEYDGIAILVEYSHGRTFILAKVRDEIKYLCEINGDPWATWDSYVDKLKRGDKGFREQVEACTTIAKVVDPNLN